MGNNMVHFNTCAISYIISVTNYHLYKIYDVYKEKEEKKKKGKKMTYIINTDVMNELIDSVRINDHGQFHIYSAT